jgi:hypothetical protein
MEIKHIILGGNENNRFEKIIRILFGAVCISVALFWLYFNIKALKSDGTLWITIVFLSGFGLYQIWSGLGKTLRFIEFGPEYLKLKKNSFFPATVIRADDIEKIELYPFNIIFYMKTKKKIMLRLGATFQETNEKIKDEIILFAESKTTPVEIIKEKI